MLRPQNRDFLWKESFKPFHSGEFFWIPGILWQLQIDRQPRNLAS